MRILGEYSNYIAFNLAAGLTVIAAMIVIVDRARRGERPALLLLVASGLTAIGTLVQILLLFSVVPRNFLALHAMELGIVLQVALLSLGLADRMRQIRMELAEREKSERLLHTMLPAPIAVRLKAGESPIADRFAEVTVLFADIAGFTPLSAQLSPERLVQTLNTLFSRFDALTSARGLEKIKTIGDCYMVVGGLPSPRPDHVEAVADLALTLRAALAPTGAESNSADPPLEIRMRVGIHCGSAVAGVIGTHKPAYDLWGDTVNTASRMESHSEPDHIHCSEAVYLQLRDRFEFSERGEIEIRGKGLMRTYYLLGRRASAVVSPTA
jgi:class 3 adenylate cyclase